MATKVMLQESKGACNKLKLKYRHWKAKALRYMKELSFVPWQWDQVWTQGFHWGFESFRTLVLQPKRWQIDQENCGCNFLTIPQIVVDEEVEIRAELFPDVGEDNIHGLYPEDVKIPQLPPNLEESLEDEDKTAPVS